MRHLFCLSIVWLLGARVLAAEILASTAGVLALERPECRIVPQLYNKEWQSNVAGGALGRDDAGAYLFKIEIKDGGKINGKAYFEIGENGALNARYTFVPDRDVTLNSLHIGLTLPYGNWAGGAWVCDGREGALPHTHDTLTVVSQKTGHLSIVSTDKKERLNFTMPEALNILIQDNYQWDSTYSVRLGFLGRRNYKAGEELVLRFTLTTDQPLRLELDDEVTIQAGPDWIPLRQEPEIAAGSALDFTRLGLRDAPAGKHGWMLAKGPDFEFEKLPGVAQRFYGVNLCFSACYLEPDEAAQLATRLARVGYNTLRLHHHDGGLVEGSADGTTVNPAQMARLDSLAAACISNGIYLTTDLFVSRRVPWRSVGIERKGLIAMNEFKVLVAVHEGALENLKNFTRQWMTHVNPHTGRSYAHEPALAWLALINEGNLGNFLEEMRGIPEWTEAWQKWLAERREREPESYGGIPDTLPGNYYESSRHTSAFTLFLREMEERMTKRLTLFLRDELGCRALITNRSSWTNRAVDQLTRNDFYDFVDDHFYVDHPQFIEKKWRLPSRCSNRNPLRNDALGVQGIVFTRLLDKPFAVTEYNYSGPGRFRGVGGIVTGAMGALQGWDGIWRFTFSHSRDTIVKQDGGAMGYFDMAGDPLSLAAERASICLFLRGDLKPLQRSYAMVLPRARVERLEDKSPMNAAAWRWLAWYARLGTLVADQAPAWATWSASFPEVYALPDGQVRQLIDPQNTGAAPAGDGAVTVDGESGSFILRTARTCGGFAEQGRVDAGDLAFELKDAAATVWVSSLDAQPISKSGHLLLTHLTDVQNSGIRYGERARQTLLAWGGLPHLARKGAAEIKLALERPASFKVHALTTGGHRAGEIATKVIEGRLVFTAAIDRQPDNATLLYEIVRE